MSTSGKIRRTFGIKVYFAVTFLCRLILVVYNDFSHGVSSDYMTYLYVPPLIFGLLPSVVIWLFPAIPCQPAISADVYHAGVAAVTVSCLLRGIFEIAGTYSPYQEYLMSAGVLLLIAGAVLYPIAAIVEKIKK